LRRLYWFKSRQIIKWERFLKGIIVIKIINIDLVTIIAVLVLDIKAVAIIIVDLVKRKRIFCRSLILGRKIIKMTQIIIIYGIIRMISCF
jgi:hypothetical protein